MTDATTITLAIILTAAGAAVAAGLITGVVELLKALFPTIVGGSEQAAAFILSGILVLVAVAGGVQDGTITLTIASIFAAVLAWYGIARLAMGIHDDATRQPNSLTGPPA